jgi:hypothetical protein
MFWRVFGPAWTGEEIDRQLTLLKGAGVGGVMTCFTYPVALDDPASGILNQTFLSPQFLETLRHAARRARQLGLAFGVCGGTGWPFGGPTVSTHDAAQRLRMEIAPPRADGTGYDLPELREGERILATFPHERGRCVFVTGPTRMAVKRAALGGEGYVADHFSREAALRYLEAVVAPMLDAAEGRIDTVFCDSLEVYGANWTHDFPAHFRRLRGYDLIPRTPARAVRGRGGGGARPALRFLADCRGAGGRSVRAPRLRVAARPWRRLRPGALRDAVHGPDGRAILRYALGRAV